MAKDVRKLKDRAAELMAKRRFDKAAEQYRELCQLEPRDLGLRQKLAEALRSSGELPESVDLYQQIADRFAREGLLLKAIAINKIILELDPTHTATQATLAALYAQRQGKVGGPRPKRPADEALAPASQPDVIESPLELDLASERNALLPGELDSRLTPIEELGEIELDLEPEGSAPVAASPGETVERSADVGPDRRSEADLPTPELDLDVEAEMAQLVAVPPEAPPPPRLPEIPIFSDLEPAAFVELLQQCALRRFPGGEAIVRQGEPGRSFFVVSSGSVRVRRKGELGEPIELARLSEGAFFGEMALLSDAPRSASVEADGPVELLEFPAAVLRTLMTDHPSAKRAIDRFTRSRLLSSVMATSPLFRPFASENRKLLIERFRVREVGAAEAVLRQGVAGDGLYVLMQGRLEVRRHEGGDPAGILLSELREGDVFGEMSLLTRSAASADVIAKVPSRVLRLPRQVFDELILTHPQILELVAKLSEERMQTNLAVLGGKVACDTEGLMLL
ncbi:MAG: cyclic nucleotide-binding domain-containing protein [Deltaproteobacteria bacterium]